jgi:hypothetical protein
VSRCDAGRSGLLNAIARERPSVRPRFGTKTIGAQLATHYFVQPLWMPRGEIFVIRRTLSVEPGGKYSDSIFDSQQGFFSGANIWSHKDDVKTNLIL